MKTMTRDMRRVCPCCAERGHLDYVEVRPSIRTVTRGDGFEIKDHFDVARDYSCRNCDAEFTLTRWES